MQKMLAKWLFPTIFVGVIVFLILFLVQVNQTDTTIYTQKVDIPQAEELPEIQSREKWIERFSQQEDQGYFYPVTEIFVEVDLKDPPKKRVIYQLKADKLDPYQLYCLKGVLKHYNVKYVFRQNSNNMKLIITSKSFEQLKAIVKALKKYAINAKIIKKDI